LTDNVIQEYTTGTGYTNVCSASIVIVTSNFRIGNGHFRRYSLWVTRVDGTCVPVIHRDVFIDTSNTINTFCTGTGILGGAYIGSVNTSSFRMTGVDGTGIMIITAY